MLASIVIVSVLVAANLFGADAERPAPAPSVVTVSGNPNSSAGSYDVGEFGYLVEEFFVSGNAMTGSLTFTGSRVNEPGKK